MIGHVIPNLCSYWHLCFCLLGEAMFSDVAGQKWGEVEGKQDRQETIVIVIKVRGS